MTTAPVSGGFTIERYLKSPESSTAFCKPVGRGFGIGRSIKRPPRFIEKEGRGTPSSAAAVVGREFTAGGPVLVELSHALIDRFLKIFACVPVISIRKVALAYVEIRLAEPLICRVARLRALQGVVGHDSSIGPIDQWTRP